MMVDWVECKLGEVFLIERGGSPRPIKEFVTTDANGVNWIKIGDATNSSKYIKSTIQKIKPSGLKKSREVFPGDLILSNSMSFGRPYIMGIMGAIHDGWLVFRENRHIEKDFIYHSLGSPTTFNQFSKNAKGSTVKNLNIKIVEDVDFLLPPLPIQRAIVSKIESLFSSLDSGIADLKKAQAQLKIYRQAVLKKAFEGELTSRELTKEGIPKDWNLLQLKDACENIKVGVVIKPAQYYTDSENGIKAFRSANVRENRINDTNWVYFNKEGHKVNKRTQLSEGDVLIVRSGYPGTSCVVTKDFAGCNAIDILIATPNLELILPNFLCAFNNSPLAKGLFSKGSRGVAQKHLNVGVYSKLSILLPPIFDQKQILKEIESRLSVCDKVDKDIKDSLVKATALRQSILKKAFEGKLLTKAEIEKCKQEADYEPASVLLERIRKEKK